LVGLAVNFTNILRTAFAPISNPNRKQIEAVQNTFVQKAACKMLVKFTAHPYTEYI